jgi:cell division protein FtsQ
MKKFKHIALWGGFVLYLVLALSFVGRKREHTICSKVKVQILDSLQDRFVSSKNIQNYIYDLDIKVLGEPVGSINIRRMESYLEGKPVVEQAEMYFTANGDLNIEIDQRNPILRVINKKGRSYYIDREGVIIPLSSKHASHVLVASGEIVEFFELAKFRRLPCPKRFDGKKDYTLCKIFEMAVFIHDHPFWKSQIEQIYVNEKGEYELIPRVGGHLIRLGSYSDYREKLRNLRAFYQKGLNNVGWNQYLEINLKYEDQIICTKR